MKETLVISAYTCCNNPCVDGYLKDYKTLEVNIYDFKQLERFPNAKEIEEERKWWESSLHLMSTESHLNKFKNKLIRVDNPDFPNNFIKYIKENIGKVDVIFVDSDIRIRQWLYEAKIKFVTVYPWYDCLQEWIGRMYLQDTPDIVIRNKINGWIHEICPAKEPLGDDLIQLSHGEYIDNKLIEDCFILGHGVNKVNE